jgi:cell division protein FtsI/penicillin-binding protein 2
VRVELGGDDLFPAERLLGRVQEPTLDDLLRQRRDAAKLRELERLPRHGEDEVEELQRLIGEVRLPDELRGVEGVEAFFDRELTGQNGFTITRGLSDVFAAGGDEIPLHEPVDGEDLVLTLRSDLQAAAQRCLRQPSAEHEDDEWEQNPVGAIVVVSREGDVLAAASEPDGESFVAPEAEGQRQLRIERTLKKPTFQPPGSAFKVFVAAWALEHGLDTARTVECAPLADGGAGYKTLRCWNTSGHGPMDLHAALVQSCNAYFAWLGETLATEEFAALCAQFGFGEPTGVRALPPWDDGLERRAGLSEDRAGLSLPKDGAELSVSLRSMAANGLGRIEATPMQLARGVLALARGERRDLRLVERIGARELPRAAGTALDFRPATLDFVRAAMRGVAVEPRGTAHDALGPARLGFEVAVKTGSADLENRKDREGKTHVRKHAWVVGWAPARAPELVFVVFEHDTTATSSHGAVYLARELLRQPEVLLYLAERGVDVSGVPAR